MQLAGEWDECNTFAECSTFEEKIGTTIYGMFGIESGCVNNDEIILCGVKFIGFV